MSIKTILVGLALESERDPVALRAIRLARQHGARLIGVHVIEQSMLDDHEPPLPGGRDAVIAALEEDARGRMQAMLGDLLDLQAGTESHVEAGDPFEIIDRLHRQHGADLLVIGPGRADNIRERIFGSTADQLVCQNRSPILVVKTEPRGDYARIAAAVDFSPMSEEAVAGALRLAPGAAIDLVHAVDIPLPFMQAMRKAGTPQAEIDRYREARMQHARQRIETVYARDGKLPERAQISVLAGPASDVLIRMASQGAMDLIALGTQGRQAVPRLVMGSVARKVLRTARADVLVVPARG